MTKQTGTDHAEIIRLMRNTDLRNAHQDHADLCQRIPLAGPGEIDALRARADQMWSKIQEMTRCPGHTHYTQTGMQ